MKSDLDLPPIDDSIDVTSRHNIVDDHDVVFDVVDLRRRRHFTSRPRTLLCIDVVGSRRRRRRCVMSTSL